MEKYILNIDNDTQELRKLREFLIRERYNIMTATDREKALRIISQSSH